MRRGVVAQEAERRDDRERLDAAPVARLVLVYVLAGQVGNLRLDAGDHQRQVIVGDGVEPHEGGKRLRHRKQSDARVKRARAELGHHRVVGASPARHEPHGLLGIAPLARREGGTREVGEVVHAVQHEAPLGVVVHDDVPVVGARGSVHLHHERRGAALHVPRLRERIGIRQHGVRTRHDAGHPAPAQAPGKIFHPHTLRSTPKVSPDLIHLHGYLPSSPCSIVVQPHLDLIRPSGNPRRPARGRRGSSPTPGCLRQRAPHPQQ